MVFGLAEPCLSPNTIQFEKNALGSGTFAGNIRGFRHRV
jgi:hypothetical protein